MRGGQPPHSGPMRPLMLRSLAGARARHSCARRGLASAAGTDDIYASLHARLAVAVVSEQGRFRHHGAVR